MHRSFLLTLRRHRSHAGMRNHLELKTILNDSGRFLRTSPLWSLEVNPLLRVFYRLVAGIHPRASARELSSTASTARTGGLRLRKGRDSLFMAAPVVVHSNPPRVLCSVFHPAGLGQRLDAQVDRCPGCASPFNVCVPHTLLESRCPWVDQ